MSLAQLGVCAGAIYTFFLAWGLLQERIGTQAYPRRAPAASADAFASPLLLNAVQCFFSALVAALYLLLLKPPAPGVLCPHHSRAQRVSRLLGVHALTHRGAADARKPTPTPTPTPTRNSNPSLDPDSKPVPVVAPEPDATQSFFPPLLVRYVAISLFQSVASQLAFLALSWGVSYPMLTLAKSCKLVPVLLMNVLLYRRRFAAYKYAVVALVTTGIVVFMFCGHPKPPKSSPASSASAGTSTSSSPQPASAGAGVAANSAIGLLCLVLNLGIDGATNSTQDEVFSRYAVSGPQMMLVMNGIATLLQVATLLLPSPRADTRAPNELVAALAFLRSHEQIARDVVLYALAGALGQVAIFETLERFGSLTLVSITVTRKLFTMLLSVFLYAHPLTRRQWLGAAIVFLGIAIEARQKRREGHAKAQAQAQAQAQARTKATPVAVADTSASSSSASARQRQQQPTSRAHAPLRQR